MKPRAIVLRSAGANCDAETAHAFELAGAKAESIHVNRLLERQGLLDDAQILAIPGGFSYGDDIAAGRILANQIQHHLHDALHAFVEAGKAVIGICNGFQVLVKTDLLPGSIGGASGQTCTLTNNDSGRFVDRWVTLRAHPSQSIWTTGLSMLELPIAHGEGKFVPANERVRQALWDGGHVALTYALASPADTLADVSPNGSIDDIAGICDATGRVFGLMPHPERHVRGFQHPAWTSRQGTTDRQQLAVGARIFQNAVAHVSESVGSGV